jgi:Do/DeqQ family serine protease
MTQRRAPPLLPLLLLLLAACSGREAARDTATTGLPATADRAPVDARELRLSFAPVVKKSAPAVVNVFSKRVVRQQLDPFWGAFMGGPITRDLVQRSLGSGSIVRPDGVVLTNHHVIDGAQEIMVVTADRREWPARVLLDDPRDDLAVLKVDPGGERLPALAIHAADDLQVGDLVLAIGDPFGVGQTVTNGIVSALGRSSGAAKGPSYFIQTDAAINPGNSGGPLVDMNGDLIGVNTAILSPSGASAGIGFAIPAAMARQVVATAVGGGRAVVRPWIGARTQSLTGEMARSLGLSAPRGVLVADLWPDGPAARAGITRGEVILAVDGNEVNDDTTLAYRVGARADGATAKLRVRKPAGGERTVEVRLAAPPDTPSGQPITVRGPNPLAGASLVNLSPARAAELGVDPFLARGVMVTGVEGGPAREIGLRPGDFIRQINGRTVARTGDLAAALRSDDGDWAVTIQRDGQLITARVAG